MSISSTNGLVWLTLNHGPAAPTKKPKSVGKSKYMSGGKIADCLFGSRHAVPHGPDHVLQSMVYVDMRSVQHGKPERIQ